jgi:hypothetical protein
MSRSSGPTESGPGSPPPGEARRAASSAQVISTLWPRAARQCQSPPHVSSPSGLQAVSALAQDEVAEKIEVGLGRGRGQAIRNIYYSDRQLPPGHDPGADSG